MFHLLRRAYVLAALVFCQILAFPPTASSAEEPRIFRLQNGLTVLVREDARFPLASVRLYVKAGSAWERPDEAGISHLLEHMVFKGSKTREAGVDKMVENAGGYLNASTSYDTTIYLTDLPSAKWKTAMEAVRDLAFDPLLRQSDLDAEREVVLAEMKQRGDSPYTKMFHAMLGTVLKGTPYESPVIGHEETLRAATPESIRAYIERRYDPRDMLLVVAGNVKAQDVLKEAETLFGAYPNRHVAEVPAHIKPADLARGLQVQVQEGPWGKTYASIAFPLPGTGAARLPAADVLARLLAGDDTALLPRKLRLDKPVVDSVMASAMTFDRLGVFIVMAQLDPDKMGEFLTDFSGILGHLRASDFTDEELNRAKLNLEDDFLRGQETIADIADLAGDIYFSNPADPAGSGYLQSIRDVDRAQVQGVIDDWLRPDALTLTTLVPKGSGVTAEKMRADIVSMWPKAAASLAKAEAVAKQDAAGNGSSAAVLADPEIIPLGKDRTLILLADKSLPYVSATLTFSGGELLLGDKNKAGLAALTASMLTAGTAAKTNGDINIYLSDRAAGVGATSAYLDFTINLDAPTRYAKDVFSLLRDMLTTPAFRQEDLDRLKREQIAGIASQEESAMGLLSRNLRPFLFPDAVYGHRPDGTPESIKGLTSKDTAAFWKLQSEQPWVLAVAGDFNRDEVLEFAKSLPAPKTARVSGTNPAWSKDKTLALKLPGREQAVSIMLFPTEPLASKDSAALRLLSASLDGFGGLLFQELREKQSLGYSVSPAVWAGEHAGFLYFAIVAAPENLEKAQEAFARIARQLQEQPLPEATLDRAKAMLEADYYKGQQRRAGRADAAARQTLYGRPVDYTLQRLEEIKKLNPADLQAVAKKYLNPAKAYSLQVTP